jgi:DNA-binding MarR family transcriptional regulator
VKAVEVTHSETWQESHLQNDLFTAVAYRYGIKRRSMPTVLLQSLGAAALPVWRELLAVPEATAQELAAATGLSVDSVKRVLRKMAAASLVYVVRKEGKRHINVWALADDADERAAIIVPETTGYGSGVRNAELGDRLQARWLERKIDDAQHAQRSGDDTPEQARKIAKLREKIVTIRQRSDVRAAQLEAMGVKPIKHYDPKPFMRYDLAEQEREHAEALTAWFNLADLTRAERTRAMHLAGWTDADIQAAVKMSQRRKAMAAAQEDDYGAA